MERKKREKMIFILSPLSTFSISACREGLGIAKSSFCRACGAVSCVTLAAQNGTRPYRTAVYQSREGSIRYHLAQPCLSLLCAL